MSVPPIGWVSTDSVNRQVRRRFPENVAQAGGMWNPACNSHVSLRKEFQEIYFSVNTEAREVLIVV